MSSLNTFKDLFCVKTLIKSALLHSVYDPMILMYMRRHLTMQMFSASPTILVVIF